MHATTPNYEVTKANLLTRYMRVSKAFEGRGEEMTTGDAILELRQIIRQTFPFDSLNGLAKGLLQQIITMGEGRGKPETGFPTTTTVLAFPERRRDNSQNA